MHTQALVHTPVNTQALVHSPVNTQALVHTPVHARVLMHSLVHAWAPMHTLVHTPVHAQSLVHTHRSPLHLPLSTHPSPPPFPPLSASLLSSHLAHAVLLAQWLCRGSQPPAGHC